MRKISYALAINEAFHQIMEKDDKVFQIGVGVNTPWYVGNTMKGLLERYTETRMIDTPVSENGIMGVGVGAAITGYKPIVTFPRMDFMYYAMDQIFNHAATLNYSLGGNLKVALTIRAIINRGGEQAAQHSQALQAIFLHIPGIKVVMPSNAYDAKGLLLSAIEDDNPVLFVDDRWLYEKECDVPEEYYTVPIGKGRVTRTGKDISVVASSYLVTEVEKAAFELEKKGIDIEIIDLRTISPIDTNIIIQSLEKTGKLAVIDGGWSTGGVSSEIISQVATSATKNIKYPVLKMALPDIPAPAARVLEKEYYFDENDIVIKIENYLKGV